MAQHDPIWVKLRPNSSGVGCWNHDLNYLQGNAEHGVLGGHDKAISPQAYTLPLVRLLAGQLYLTGGVQEFLVQAMEPAAANIRPLITSGPSPQAGSYCTALVHGVGRDGPPHGRWRGMRGLPYPMLPHAAPCCPMLELIELRAYAGNDLVVLETDAGADGCKVRCLMV